MSAATHPTGVHVDPDVFVSYRRTDKEFVERFVSALENQGPEVWWDADIGGGEDWRDSIVENLVDSDCLVIVFSESCNASKQLVKELAVADHLNKVVIPVKIDDSEPTGSFLYELAWRNWVNVHPDPMSKLDDAAAHIVASLKEAGWTRSPTRSGSKGDGLPTLVPLAPPADETQVLAPPAAPTPLAPPIATAPQRPAPHGDGASAVRTASSIPDPAEFRWRDAFPFHWADFILPVLAAILVLLNGEDGDSLSVTIGDALSGAVMVLAITGLIAFPIRYYRRRANPYRVARNLLLSNVTFAVAGAAASLLTASSMVEEGETTGSVQIDLSIGFLMFGLLFALISFGIFFALSKARAKRELEAHMNTV